MEELVAGADLCDVAVRQIGHAIFWNAAQMAMVDRTAELTGQAAPPKMKPISDRRHLDLNDVR
jgi:hypothetical protein